MKGQKIWPVFSAICLVCCSPRIVEKVITETVTEVRDSIAWRDTTIYVPVPLESNQVIVFANDTTHLETSVAESDAWVSPDGFLHHTLNNKPTRIPYKAILPERWLMTEVKNTKEQTHVIEREVMVEKPLNPWQRFRIGAFWWLLAIAAAGWRKPLFSIIRRIASACKGY